MPMCGRSDRTAPTVAGRRISPPSEQALLHNRSPSGEHACCRPSQPDHCGNRVSRRGTLHRSAVNDPVVIGPDLQFNAGASRSVSPRASGFGDGFATPSSGSLPISPCDAALGRTGRRTHPRRSQCSDTVNTRLASQGDRLRSTVLELASDTVTQRVAERQVLPVRTTVISRRAPRSQRLSGAWPSRWRW